MTRKLLSAVVICCVAASLWAGGDDDAAKDRKKFQGAWKVVAMEVAGKKVPDESLNKIEMRLVFKDNRYEEQVLGKTREDGQVKLDPSKKPKHFDLVIESGNDKGKLQPGLYEFDGEAIRIALARPGDKERPTGFSTKEDSLHVVIVLRRQKD